MSGSGSGERLLILLHGTGGDEGSLLELGRALDPAANLLGMRGLSNEEGVNRFFRRFGEGVFDEGDMRLQAGALAAFLRSKRLEIGATGRVLTVGYSNGANMGAALLLLHPDVMDGAILFRAQLPLQAPTVPDLAGKRVFLATGERDAMISLEGATELVDLLRRAGAEVTQLIEPVGHGLTREDILAAKKWLTS